MFVGRAIRVEAEGRPLEPKVIHREGRAEPVLEILSTWHDWTTGRGAPRGAGWRLRRHRTYFQVRTPRGDWEIYLDRSRRGDLRWFITRELGPPKELDPPGQAD